MTYAKKVTRTAETKTFAVDEFAHVKHNYTATRT